MRLGVLLILFGYPIFAAKVYFVYSEAIKLHKITLNGFQSKRENIELVESQAVMRKLSDCETKKDSIVVVLGKDLLDNVLQYCQKVPVVFAHVSAPQTGDYRTNYTNATGIGFEVSLRYFLEDLKRLVPEGSRIGFIYSSDTNDFLTNEIKYLEVEYGLIGERFRIETREELGEAIKNLIDEKKIKVLWVMPDPIYNRAVFRKLAEICIEKKVILVTNFEALVKEVGAAFALAPSYFDVGVQLTQIVAKIEKGVPPYQIPFAQPQKIGTYVNTEVFKKLGIAIPEDIKNREKVTDLVDMGMDLLNMGQSKEALAKFREALRYDKKSTVANYYVNLLEAKENYAIALELLQNQNTIAALPYLVMAADFLAEARAKLNMVRQELKGELNRFLKEGVAAFQQKKYKECIQNMKIVLMLEPNHREAELYIEKAEKRARAVAEIRQ